MAHDSVLYITPVPFMCIPPFNYGNVSRIRLTIARRCISPYTIVPVRFLHCQALGYGSKLWTIMDY